MYNKGHHYLRNMQIVVFFEVALQSRTRLHMKYDKIID